MPKRCCVPMCSTSGGHKFPRDAARRKLWINAICRDNFKPTQSSLVCKKHFLPEDYIKEPITNALSPFLKKHAVPTQFAWTANSFYVKKTEKLHNGKNRRKKVAKNRKNKEATALHNDITVKEEKMSAVESEEFDDKAAETKKTEATNDIMDMDKVPKDTNQVVHDKKKDGDVIQNNAELILECRACLQQLELDRMYNLFQTWPPAWDGLQSTIADDLTKLTDLQISESDRHSKLICHTCCEKLWSACHFKLLVKDTERVLRERFPDDPERVWPKPIQMDNGFYEGTFNVDIKQEVLTDDENNEDTYTEPNCLDIKVEPEEIIEPATIAVNGVTSLSELPSIAIPELAKNEDSETHNDKELLQEVKEEPPSESEDTELSLECLLCSKVFASVTGLKAHVIAQHSYQTVGRKVAESTQPPEKHVCAMCRRTFATSTDLMVHETCHNKHSCYACSAKFDTFSDLSEHRRRCKALASAELKRPKTLDDVIRPQVEDGLLKERGSKEINHITNIVEDEKRICTICSEEFTDPYYMKIHQEIHHSSEQTALKITNAVSMDTDALESIFEET